ncbi:MAG TPA: hypothetical protein VMT81_00875 [Candidatus Paceibacterota bacterium]|nr:hypothetical protein [Candidatus Paceibacterota bacterium]
MNHALAAAITINNSIPGLSISSSTGPAGWVVSFYYFALLASGILAFGAIVYGGLKYATSVGNASRQSEGRSWIWSAIIGLLLLAGAYLILTTINPGLVKLQIAPISSLPSSTTAAGQ